MFYGFFVVLIVILIEKMVRIREYYDFSVDTVYELIECYWVDAYKSRNNHRWRYFWWKLEFRQHLISALEKKWRSGLPDLYFFLEKINELHNDFDPRSYFDSELYIEKFMRITKGLKKKK